MAYNIKTINREQIYLMPPSLQEWLPEKDMAWFIIDVVGNRSPEFFLACKKFVRSGEDSVITGA